MRGVWMYWLLVYISILKYSERPIRVKRPMSDVPIFRRKNSDVQFRFWCFLVVRSCFSRSGRRPHLTIVSRLPGWLTAAIWMRVGVANYVIACGWRWGGADSICLSMSFSVLCVTSNFWMISESSFLTVTRSSSTFVNLSPVSLHSFSKSESVYGCPA